MRSDYGIEARARWANAWLAPNNAIIASLPLKNSKRITIRRRHEFGVHGGGLKS